MKDLTIYKEATSTPSDKWQSFQQKIGGVIAKAELPPRVLQRGVK